MMNETGYWVGYWVRCTLDELAWHWDGAYRFVCHAYDRWTATRADNGRTLIAGDPVALRQLVRVDYIAQPVTRDEGPRRL